MTSFHMTLCSAALFAVLGLVGCQSPEEREAAVERDAFTQLVDEVEGHMNETLALLQTLWDIELEYGTPEGADRTYYRFFPLIRWHRSRPGAASMNEPLRRIAASMSLSGIAPSKQESTTYEPSLVCKLLILGCRLLIPDRLL